MAIVVSSVPMVTLIELADQDRNGHCTLVLAILLDWFSGASAIAETDTKAQWTFVLGGRRLTMI
ncbi:hypothetical protein [Rhizobium mongolense]|uniref:hypothetical protein n=1 Tax=Rhizobium mongolense TaxID=57676 RepID=UPI0034A32B4C